MSRLLADVLLALGVVSVIVTGYIVATYYGPGGHRSGMAPVMFWPTHVLVMTWGLFIASLVALWLMYRVWRTTR